jgi:hypothetical protein
MNCRAALAGALAAFPAIAGAASLVGTSRGRGRRTDLRGDRAPQDGVDRFRRDGRLAQQRRGRGRGKRGGNQVYGGEAAANDALEAFLATPPMTLAGLRAALEYVVEVDSGCVLDNGGRIAETLLRSPALAA